MSAPKSNSSSIKNHAFSKKDDIQVQVQIPKIPFALIHLYQNLVPLSVIVFFDLGLLFCTNIFQISTFLQIVLLPLLFLANYFLYIWSITFASKLLHLFYNKQSPPQQGVFSRTFKDGNVSNPILHYYHLRGFLNKWPVWVAKKSLFPWTLNYVLRIMAGNKISKNFMYGDVYVGLELTDLRDGGVIMDGGIISSHVVDSLYGNLTIKECHMNKNAVMMPNSVMTPGGNIDSNMVLGPNAFLPKEWVISDPQHQFIYGVPAKNKGYVSVFDLLPKKYQKMWNR